MTKDQETTYKGDILVVDDSPDNLRVLSERLTSIGYRVRCVTNGEMAIISINTCRPNLVLLDIRMPILDGYEVCQRIKSNPETRDIPVIFLSAIDNVVDKVKAFEMGGADYITKPFQSEEILARIANQLTIQRLQKQLELQNRELQKEIDAHKQTEAALQDAKEAAEIANHAKSNFIAKMSHELRTPLNIILGFSELMDDDESLSDEHQEYISSINQSAQSLLKTINQVLKITKAEANQISLRQRTFNLRSFLETLASEFRHDIHQRGLGFSFTWNERIPDYIHLDDGKLRQILGQLLKHISQSMKSGQISLRIDLEGGDFENFIDSAEPELGGMLPLFFEIDCGSPKTSSCGDSDFFEPFSQVRSDQSSNLDVDFGLYISQQYIQAMGGQIAISSNPNQRARIRFYLPFKPVSKQFSDLDINVNDTVDETLDDDYIEILGLPHQETEKLMQAAISQGLSCDWVVQLNRAAIQGFDHQIARLIQAIPEAYFPLKKPLSEWNQHFQFDQIINVTQRVLECDS